LSTFVPPSPLIPLTKARSLDINALSDAVDVAFELLPDEQVIGSGTVTYAVDSGVSPNAYIVNLPNPPSSYRDGMEVVFRPKNSSNGASSINVNGLGVVSIKRIDGTGIQFDIIKDIPTTVRYSEPMAAFFVENASTPAAIAAAAQAASSAAAAAAAAANLVEASDLISSSTTSVAIGMGIKNFTTQANKKFTAGMPIRAASNATPAARMDGYVRSYDANTGQLQMQVESFNGSGTFADWNIFITGQNSVTNNTGGSTTVSGLSSDYTIVAGTTNPYLKFSVANGGAVVMPANPSTLPGKSQYVLSNVTDVSNNLDLQIKDSLGNIIQFLTPNRTTDCHMNAESQWVFPEGSPIGKPVRYNGPAASRIASTNGTFVQTVRVDADRILIILHGISVQAVMFNQTTSTFGSVTLIRAAWGTTGGSYDNVRALLTATDQVLIASCPENTNSAPIHHQSNQNLLRDGPLGPEYLTHRMVRQP